MFGGTRMLARLARIIGDHLAVSLELPGEAAERAAFALEILMLDVLTIGCILLAAWATGLFWPALAATITAAAMRALAGGAHSESPYVCILMSTFLALACGFLGRWLAPFLTTRLTVILVGVIALAGMAVLSRYAPADTPAKPIPPAQAEVLKRLSLALLALWAAGCLLLPLGPVLRGASIGGISWQLLSVTPTGSMIVRSLDGLFGVRGGGDA